MKQLEKSWIENSMPGE